MLFIKGAVILIVYVNPHNPKSFVSYGNIDVTSISLNGSTYKVAKL